MESKHTAVKRRGHTILFRIRGYWVHTLNFIYTLKKNDFTWCRPLEGNSSLYPCLHIASNHSIGLSALPPIMLQTCNVEKQQNTMYF